MDSSRQNYFRVVERSGELRKTLELGQFEIRLHHNNCEHDNVFQVFGGFLTYLGTLNYCLDASGRVKYSNSHNRVLSAATVYIFSQYLSRRKLANDCHEPLIDRRKEWKL